tara:strand:+ start:420 stop:764 length:345 start_codon:yes stop_codon:yes gene_type:complete
MATSFLDKFKNFVFGKKQSQDVVNSLEDFNNLTNSYNELLGQQIDQKKKRNTSLRSFLSGYRPKDVSEQSTINIQLVDMNNTVIKKRGKSKIKKTMEWEKEFRKMKGNNKGIII